MTIQGVFEAALLRYIQANIDQRAEGIRGFDVKHSCCWGHSEDDSCCCDTSIKVSIDYWVPREVNRFGYVTWEYSGDFFELIAMLDRVDKEAGL